MNNKRIPRRIARLTSALLAVAMAAVLLTASPVSAATDGSTNDAALADGAVVSPGIAGDKGDGTRAARTTTGNAIELPAFAFTPCPELTDSVVRLYSAYYLRAPDEGGFNFWLDEYSAGNWSLPLMSAFFAQSPEFVDMYGGITDAEFINLLYTNIFDRNADESGSNYWLGRMQNEGLDRGTVMLYFSESPEYVDLTQTYTPFAGEFNWYPDGTQWGCGFGDLDAALPAGATYVDLAFYNNTARPNTVTANLMINGRWENWDQATLDPTDWFIFFGAAFDDNSITGLQLQGTDEFIWTLVYSPAPTPPVRAGWDVV